MKVYFERSNGELVLLNDDVGGMAEAWKIIYDFLELKGFKSYYSRTWQVDDYKKVDVGSHTEFFRIYGGEV